MFKKKSSLTAFPKVIFKRKITFLTEMGIIYADLCPYNPVTLADLVDREVISERTAVDIFKVGNQRPAHKFLFGKTIHDILLKRGDVTPEAWYEELETAFLKYNEEYGKFMATLRNFMLSNEILSKIEPERIFLDKDTILFGGMLEHAIKYNSMMHTPVPDHEYKPDEAFFSALKNCSSFLIEAIYSEKKEYHVETNLKKFWYAFTPCLKIRCATEEMLDELGTELMWIGVNLPEYRQDIEVLRANRPAFVHYCREFLEFFNEHAGVMALLEISVSVESEKY